MVTKLGAILQSLGCTQGSGSSASRLAGEPIESMFFPSTCSRTHIRHKIRRQISINEILFIFQILTASPLSAAGCFRESCRTGKSAHARGSE